MNTITTLWDVHVVYKGCWVVWTRGLESDAAFFQGERLKRLGFKVRLVSASVWESV